MTILRHVPISPILSRIFIMGEGVNYPNGLYPLFENIKILLANSDRQSGSITCRSSIFIDTYTLPSHQHIDNIAIKSLSIDNAGGKSEISEMFSIHYFVSHYNATNIIFETEVSYWIDYKMVDFICTIADNRVGVSVARAMGFPSPDKFTSEHASRLLHKKLYGLIVARNGVIKSQSFYKSILHIWCQNHSIAYLIHQAFISLDQEDYGLDVTGIIILQLTVCDDPQLYKNYLLFS